MSEGSPPDGSLLVAARSPIHGRTLERMARGLGWTVEMVTSCDKDMARSSSANLVLIQDELWDEGGCATAFSQGGGTALPLLVFSTDAAAESWALERGASDFLKVPCRPVDLERLIEPWLRMARADAGPSSAARALRRAPPEPEATDRTNPAPHPVTQRTESGESAETSTGPRATILLVDDSLVIHAYVEAALKPHGFHVLHAHDGAEGLAVATQERPDLILSDVDMPVMNGFDMCRKVREQEAIRDTPILILSARGAGVDIDRGFDVGANDFLTKPVSENELISRLDMTLGMEGAASRPREKVLVVEDSSLQRSVIARAIAQQGFEVITAEDGQQGLELALEHLPDLVITDSEMPVMNGRDLTRELKKREHLADIPVVMLTAADSPLSRLKGRHAGVSAYLTKPFVPDKVVVIAEKLIAERRLLREREAMHHYLSDSAAAAAAAAADSKGDVNAIMRAETRFTTILFTDIVGFTPLTERMAPAELVGLLNGYFDEMAPVFKRNGGVIDKFIGDAIMSVFVHEPGGDPGRAACNAVATGLEMLSRLERLNAGKEEAIQIRVGINSGDVVMGDIGSRALRRDYTVIGDAVNVAARLESAAEHGTVLISQSTYELVRGEYDAQPLGPIHVKGKAKKIHVFRVLGPRNDPASEGAKA